MHGGFINQKLHICTHDRQNFSGDRSHFGDFCPPLDPQIGGARTAPVPSINQVQMQCEDSAVTAYKAPYSGTHCGRGRVN